ncbi:MAG: hypothetical protein CYG60_10495 [Actinobacteria bacterium]|nr:MAG: hypothetical protein CYG60_10495 [Actinomycetota bacterium]
MDYSLDLGLIRISHDTYGYSGVSLLRFFFSNLRTTRGDPGWAAVLCKFNELVGGRIVHNTRGQEIAPFPLKKSIPKTIGNHSLFELGHFP